MNIQITRESTEKINGATYKSVDVIVEGKEVFVLTCADYNYCTVVVKNAMHRAYRGTGRQFASIQAAHDSYKDSKIKAAIAYAMAN